MVDKKKPKEPAIDKIKPKKPKKKKPLKSGKRGRKCLYDTLHIREKLEAIRGWCKQGSTDAEIMQMIGISHDTFYTWKKTRSEFSDAIRKGKEISNGELLNSAFRLATGFTVPTTVVVKLKKPVLIGGEPVFIDGLPLMVDGKVVMRGGKLAYEEIAEEIPSTEYIPPNPSMGIFMVKNRMPKEYKDKQEVDIMFKNKLESFMDE